MNILHITQGIKSTGGFAVYLKTLFSFQSNHKHFVCAKEIDEGLSKFLDVDVFSINSLFEIGLLTTKNEIDTLFIHWGGEGAFNPESEYLIDKEPLGLLNSSKECSPRPYTVVICHSNDPLPNRLNGVDLVVCVSEFVKTFQNIEELKTVVIQNGVDSKQFKPSKRKKKKNNEKLIIGLAGRLEKFDSYTIDFIKTDKDLNSLYEFRFANVNHKDMPKFFNEIDIFFHPTTGDGLGLATMEAMFSGVPVITSSKTNPVVEGLCEMKNIGTSILDTLKDFTTKLDSEELKERTKKAQAFIKEFASLENMKNGYSDLFKLIEYELSKDNDIDKFELAQEIISSYRFNSYYETYKKYETDYFGNVLEELKKDFKSRKIEDVLDIGTAYGTLALMSKLSGRNIKVDCIDMMTGYLAPNLIGEHGLNFINGDVETDFNCIPNKRYDVIILTETLEHFNYNPLPTLRNIVSRLNNDGRLYLSTPDRKVHGAINKYIRYNKMPIYKTSMGTKKIDEHIHHYTDREMKELLDLVGLDVIYNENNISKNCLGSHFNIVAVRRNGS